MEEKNLSARKNTLKKLKVANFFKSDLRHEVAISVSSPKLSLSVQNWTAASTNFAAHHNSIEACLGQYVGRTNAFSQAGGQKWVDWPFFSAKNGLIAE